MTPDYRCINGHRQKSAACVGMECVRCRNNAKRKAQYVKKKRAESQRITVCKCGVKMRGHGGRSAHTKQCPIFNDGMGRPPELLAQFTQEKEAAIKWVWRGMHARCNSTVPAQARNYRDRGITVCERWHDMNAFIIDMGYVPDGMTLDRRDNDKGYSKENCRWATRREQTNNRRCTVFLTVNGETRCASEWLEKVSGTGVTKGLLYNRLRRGWSAEAALMQPVRQ